MDFSKVKNLAIPEGNVTSISIGGKVVWKKPEEPPAVNSFYIEDASGQPNTLSLTYSGILVKLEYSTDNKVWQEWVDYHNTPIPMAANSRVYLRGTNDTFGGDYNKFNHFNCTGRFNIGGDITTLLVPEGNVLDLTGRGWTFSSLFQYSNVVDASQLILPATILARECYGGMFNGCESLTTAPKILPATTLVYYCYVSMFSGCSSLETAPELPATTLAGYCYGSMFNNCSKLNYVKVGATSWNTGNASNWLSGTAATGTVEMPEELVTWDGTGTQPAGSIPLNNVSGVPTGWTAKKPVARPNAFRFKNVSSLPNTLKLTKKTSTAPTVTLEKSSNGVDFVPFDCYSGIELQPGETVYLRGSNKTFATSVQNRNKFSSNNDIECYGSIMDLCDNGTDTIICTESYQFYGLFEDMSYLLTTPELPAITLTPHCYHALFFRCTSLASIPETLLPATTLIDDCYQTMFGQCTGLKTIPEKLLQSTELANNCYCGMFDGCTALTNSPQLPATTLAGSCYLGMFSGCTALVTAPELPATTLAYRSYESMFSKCHKINYIKIGATSWSRQVEGSIYYNASKWLEKAAAVGTIEMPAELQIGNGEGQIPENSVNGVPTGWTAKKPVVVNSFYIEDASGQPNTLSLTQTGAAPVKLEYSNDGSVWQEWVNCQSTTLPVAANSRIYLRGTNERFGKDYYNRNSFNCANRFNVGGDITTLLVSEGNLLDLTGRDKVFYYLFRDSKVIDASKLVLPATTLASGCYEYMFYGCSLLTQAPELPATTLASGCYSSMFQDCRKITETPKLPATTLAGSCYSNMFYGCSLLTQAPALPATTLAENCYENMFLGCTKLTTAPKVLPATTLASGCYSSMFEDCKSLTAASTLPATKLHLNCYNSMFNGCTSLTQAPELPATKLVGYCYYGMFWGCTSLTSAPELPATTLQYYCYYDMFKGCTSLTSAPTLPATALDNGCYSYMFDGCRKLDYVKVGATTWNTGNASNWLRGTAATGTIEMPEELVTWDGTGTQPAGSIPLNSASGIPEGWVIKAPEDHRFRFKNVSGQPNTLKLEKMHESAPTLSLEKSSNGVDFTSVDLYKGITLQKDETVYLRGNNASTTTVSDAGTAANKFTSTGLIEAHGNLNDITSGSLELKPYHFAFLFNGMENLTTAPDLPSVNLSECAYQMCFSACSNLVEGPKIYAQNLGKWSCNAMFMGCSKLKTIEMVIDHWDKPGDDFGAMIAWLNYAGPDGNLIAPNLTFADIPEGDNGLPKNWTLNGETRPVENV